MNFDQIPDEALLTILRLLDIKSLSSVRSTTKRLNNVANPLYFKEILPIILSNDKTFWEHQLQIKKQQDPKYFAQNIYFDFFNERKEIIFKLLEFISYIEHEIDLKQILTKPLPNSLAKRLGVKINPFKSIEEGFLAILENGFEIILQRFLKHHGIRKLIGATPEGSLDTDDAKTWQSTFETMLRKSLSSHNPTCLKQLLSFIYNVRNWQEDLPKGYFIPLKELFDGIETIIFDKTNKYPAECAGILIDFSTMCTISRFYAKGTLVLYDVIRPKTYICLSQCIANNKLNIANYLTQYSAGKLKTNTINWCATKAFQENNTEVFIFLVKITPEENPKVTPLLFNPDNAAQKAFDENKPEILKALLAEKLVDIKNQRDSDQRTWLHQAVVANKSIEMLNVFLGAGISLDTEDEKGFTALDYALDKPELLRTLLTLSSLALINRQYGPYNRTLLHRASIDGNYKACVILIQHNAAELEDSLGKTPLEYGDIEQFKSYINTLPKESSKNSFSQNQTFWPDEETKSEKFILEMEEEKDHNDDETETPQNK